MLKSNQHSAISIQPIEIRRRRRSVGLQDFAVQTGCWVL